MSALRQLCGTTKLATEIRRMTPADAKRLRALIRRLSDMDRRNLGFDYQQRAFNKDIRNATNLTVATDEDRLVGWHRTIPHSDGDGFVESLYVVPEYRRSGLATRLLDDAESPYRRVSAKTKPDNLGIQELLAARGYTMTPADKPGWSPTWTLSKTAGVDVARVMYGRPDGAFALSTVPREKANDRRGYLDFPGGKIDDGEIGYDAALRELAEEGWHGSIEPEPFHKITLPSAIHPGSTHDVHFFRGVDLEPGLKYKERHRGSPFGRRNISSYFRSP